VLKKSKGKSKQSKSIEVKLNVRYSKTTFMSLLLASLIGLMGYSGYLGVSSLWKFTHPQFHVSLDSLKSLGYIAKGLRVPPIAGPTIINGQGPAEADKTTFLQSVSDYKSEFLTQYPASKLVTIPDNDLLNIGWSMCTAKKDAIAKTGSYSRETIISEYQAKFVLTYPKLPGLSVFLNAVGQRAFDHLCGVN